MAARLGPRRIDDSLAIVRAYRRRVAAFLFASGGYVRAVRSAARFVALPAGSIMLLINASHDVGPEYRGTSWLPKFHALDPVARCLAGGMIAAGIGTYGGLVRWVLPIIPDLGTDQLFLLAVITVAMGVSLAGSVVATAVVLSVPAIIWLLLLFVATAVMRLIATTSKLLVTRRSGVIRRSGRGAR